MKRYKVLVACEFSGIVREAFRKNGHDAWSCDLLPTEIPGQHIQGDVLEILDDGWDLMVAHPPCTYLTIAGAAYKEKNTSKRLEAIRFFKSLKNADIPKICIENPIIFSEATNEIGKYNQIINPFEFGQPERKKICLWLKNLPLLKPTNIVNVKPKGFCIRKTGKRAGRKYNYYYHQGKNSHERSRFFEGIAEAMAEQWGNDLPERNTQLGLAV